MARFVIALTLVLPGLLPGAALAQKSMVAPTMELPGTSQPPAQPPRPTAPEKAAPTAAAPAAAKPAAAPAPAGQTADEQADLKVRTLEERVNDLKEKIFRTKARLMNLQEMVIGGDITAGAKAVLLHRNEMGSSFVLESAAYALDGAPIYTKVDQEGDLDKREEFEIFNGRIVPGNHKVSVKLVYRGHGYGVFSYLEGYKFKVQSSHTFTAEAGKVTNIKVVGFEKGGFTTDLKDRPAVRYDMDVQAEQAGKKAPVK
ncbi:MAG TPA: dihydrolipoamide acetyltransferase [Anaeromyxobacteraceae bacterium]|nr:dihydrolipoamide acetyltransferase [Anaeromyxobacteraceae bacterium]